MSNACILDLETGGTKPGCAIFSIGAVAVDLETGEISSSFYTPIDLDDATKVGTLDHGTMIWWVKQSEEARKAVFEPLEKTMSVFEALDAFQNWFIENRCETIWGNGATFDVSIIENPFERLHIKIPWNFWSVRDLRTLQDLVGNEVKNTERFEGIKHHALHDAYHEAKYASKMYQIVRSAMRGAQKDA